MPKTSCRFGFNARKNVPLEDSIRWAADHDFWYVDFNADDPANAYDSFDAARVRTVCDLCQSTGVQIGIHTSSAVNMAEVTPVMARAADEYLQANIRLAKLLGCGWVVAHGGYHFSSDLNLRWQAAIQRLQRAVGWAEAAGVPLWFENHNKEPEHAEIHYLPHTVEEFHWFWDAIDSPYFLWSFNVAHGHLVQIGRASCRERVYVLV